MVESSDKMWSILNKVSYRLIKKKKKKKDIVPKDV